LLKNDRGTLPLRKDLRTLAVIGPNADQRRMLLGNYNGIPSDAVTPLRGVREAVSRRTRVLYAKGSDLADGFPLLETIPSAALRTTSGRRGLQGAYFAGRTLEGAPVFTTTDTTIDVDWHEDAPRPDMNANDFGVRWTGTLKAPATGMYRLGVTTSMRAEVSLDDSVIVRTVYPRRDDEFPDARLAQSEPIRLVAGRTYRVRIDAHESYGEAQLDFAWATPTASLESDAVQAARQADAVILFLGLTSRLEGEEMSVAIDGFRGGDRTAIDLPAAQQRLLERVVAVGKPTVLVLLNGSAVAINWAQANVPAIVEAWYPGQAAGSAIADVLFGDYNPAGRLPVTFYKSVNDLPPFDDYRMTGRTYRFFKGEPLYAFGHGLSYTSFSYANLRTNVDSASANDTVMVSVDVTNSGKRAGDEVVQLYVQHVGSAVERPIRDLRGYRRLTLAPGETRTVQIQLAISSLVYWDASAHRWVVENDQVRIQVGASSADIRQERLISVRP
jgi:beta-glucosidase